MGRAFPSREKTKARSQAIDPNDGASPLRMETVRREKTSFGDTERKFDKTHSRVKRSKGHGISMDIQQLLLPENMALPVVTGLIVQAIRQSGKDLFATPRGARVLPVLPYIIGLALALAGIGTAGVWRERFLLGIMAGAVSSSVYKMLVTTLLARGIDVSATTPTPPPPPPQPPKDGAASEQQSGSP